MSAKCFPLSQCIQAGDLPVKIFFHKQKTSSLHYHDYNELVFVLSGHGVHVCKEEMYNISRGDVFVVKSGMEHRYEASPELLIANVLIDFSSSELALNDLRQDSGFYALFEIEPLVRERSKNSLRLHLSSRDLDTAYRYLKEIETESQLGQPGCRFAALSAFYRLLLLISRRYEQPEQIPSKNMVRLSKMLHFIETNHMRDISRDDVVRAAGISSGTGSRIFKELLGKSIFEYLTQVRIDHAKDKLCSHFNVTETAFLCGFRDSNYFSTVFKKVTGESPLTYKKQLISSMSKEQKNE